MSETPPDPDEGDPSWEREVGARIRAERKRQGLSLRQVAEKLQDGTHLTTIAKIENGQMRLTYDWARKLSSALGQPVLEFFVPEERENRAIRVPIFNDFPSYNEDSGSPSIQRYTSYFGNEEGLVATSIHANGADAVSETAVYDVIIDTNLTELVDRRVYCIVPIKLNYPVIAQYRADVMPRLIAWLSSFETIYLTGGDGRHPKIVGAVRQVQRNLISRNSKN